MNALVSVVMPAYEEQEFIGEALESVLAQTYGPIEVIVVDDGSGDRTVEIAQASGVHVLRCPHRGAAAACNAGLHLIRGEYWTIFDADDVMPPGRLARQVEYLAQNPECEIVLGLTEAFVTPGESRPPHYNPAWDDGPFPACSGTMLARRSTLEVVGRFDETRTICYDLDWLARAKDAGVRSGQLDHVALHYRIHCGNTTADSGAVNTAMLKVLRESLERRRARSGSP